MLSRRKLVGTLLAAAGLPTGGWAQKLRTSIIEGAGTTLRRAAAQRGIIYGAAVNTTELREQDFAAALAREAGLLAPEYEMKRAIVERIQGQYDFTGCDAILAFARTHDMLFRGVPLVWHKRNPDWLEKAARESRDETLITGFIEKTAGHFRGRVHSWDVVNEAIAPEDGRADGLRDSFWLQVYGPRYIDLAYRAARAADPGTLLVYNDWGCELGAPANDRFRAATLDFLERALARGVPIDALGLQGHMRAFGTPVDQTKLAVFLARVKSMGLRILVTEHDVDDSGGPSDVALRDRAVADASRRFLDVMIDVAPVALLTWGLSDRFLDAPGWRASLTGYRPRMLPLDGSLARTPMWYEMVGAFAVR
ncbi:MAG TPA: endo-1,4-beta-xylanase [Rhizomicrobium sp.]|jgi:endo-1,4-beta-xylanase|nr:endo-1,4-beta-xylanase [Rhizomicrobium sp.]